VAKDMSDPGKMTVQTIRNDDEVLILALEGEIDMRVSPGLLDQTEPLVREGPDRVVIDLTAVEFMDSSGVGTLVHLFRMLKGRKGRFVLVGPTPRVRSLFQITRLDKLFTICDTIDEAMTV
jgi:anti-sigma B factor antagonist